MEYRPTDETKRLKKELKNHNISVPEFAHIIGITTRRANDILTGNVYITMGNIENYIRQIEEYLYYKEQIKK